MADLFPIPGDFALWKWIMLRGAGFSAERIEQLASPNAALLADRLVEKGVLLDRARATAIEVYSAAIDKESGDARKPLAKILKALRAGRTPDADHDAILALKEADRAHASAFADLAAAYRNDHLAIAKFLRSAIDDQRFHEAVVWQNRNAWRNGIALLKNDPPGATDSKARQREQAVANYLQRYLLKNETIGFFGPIAWAKLSDRGPPMAIEAGAELLSKRTTYFEYWTIDALAEALLTAEPSIRFDLAPRLAPSMRLEDTTLHHPIERTTELPEEYARVIASCDGKKTARQIARELEAELPSEEVFDILAALADKKLIFWTIELPTAGFAPERALHELLEQIEDDETRARAIAPLDVLETKRAELQRAAGQGVDALSRALEELEAEFTKITGAEATRLGGQAYAGRTIAYEECVRDTRVELGPQLIATLGPPLSLLLHSARWYTHEIASRYRPVLDALFDQLTGGTKTELDWHRFSDRLAPLFGGENSIVQQVSAELRARWWELIAPREGEKRVAKTTAELEPHVKKIFAAPGPGWPAAKHHSPDLMIAAENSEAIAAGDYLWVLGELHAAINTVTNPFVVKEHPQPEELIAARERDLPAPCIARVWSKNRTRADFYSVSRHDFDLENAAVKSARPRDHVVTTGELIVERRDQRLYVTTRDRRVSFELIAFLEQHLIAESHGKFSLKRDAEHSPRVTIDRLVISREEWKLQPAELRFIELEDAVQRFAAARKFKLERGLPDQVFIKIPEETKPVYVDFRSPIFVDIFSRLARKASHVSISEMLPATNALWLPDARGHKYTSELRVVAVDG